MPTNKPILNFVVDPALLRRLDTFWHKHQFPSRAAAVKWLLENGLDRGLAPSSRDELEKALAAAPMDDEPETEEERAAVREGKEAIARGQVYPWEQVRGELLGEEEDESPRQRRKAS